MSALRDLQVRFDAALFGHEPATRAGIADEIIAGSLDPLSRMSIYRNNLRVGVANALAIEFPVIQRLVGADYFHQMALGLLNEYPSRSGDLYAIGEPFTAFVRAEFAATRYEYLADVAALEWAYQRAALAPVAEKVDCTVLRAVAPGDYDGIRFVLTDGCRVVRSHYPVLRIWMANQADASSEEAIDLASGAEDVLVQRVDSGVRVRLLSPPDATLLQAFSADCDLGVAFERAQCVDCEFDLAAQLRRYIDLNVITVASPTVRAAGGDKLQ